MAGSYSANYTAADLSEVAIDMIVGIGAAIFSFVSIFGLILAWRYAKKNVK